LQMINRLRPKGAKHRNIWCAGHAVNLKGESPEGAVMTGIL
jgi:hypothetical protein